MAKETSCESTRDFVDAINAAQQNINGCRQSAYDRTQAQVAMCFGYGSALVDGWEKSEWARIG